VSVLDRRTYTSSLMDMSRANTQAGEYFAQAARFPLRPPGSPLQTMVSTLTVAAAIDASVPSGVFHEAARIGRLTSRAIAEQQKATACSLEALDRLEQGFDERRLLRIVRAGLGALLVYAIPSDD